MRKYLALFTATFSQYLAYRMHILSQIFSNLITPVFMLTALLYSQPLTGLSARSLIPYYLLISLITSLTLSNIDEEMDDLVSTGDINNFLVKPFSLFRWLYAKNLSEKSTIFLTLFPLVVLSFFLLHSPLLTIIISLVGIILSFSLSFTFSYIIGLFCFWIDDFWPIHNTKFVAIQLLGGIVLPYSFFPASLIAFLHYSPFPYLASWVPRYLQGQVPASDLFFFAVWIIVLYLTAAFLERRSLNKYSFTAS